MFDGQHLLARSMYSSAKVSPSITTATVACTAGIPFLLRRLLRPTCTLCVRGPARMEQSMSVPAELEVVSFDSKLRTLAHTHPCRTDNLSIEWFRLQRKQCSEPADKLACSPNGISFHIERYKGLRSEVAVAPSPDTPHIQGLGPWPL